MTRVSERNLLTQAVELATNNARSGQRPFGAIVVLDGRIVAEGVNTVDRSADPSEHAEVEAIRAACRVLGSEDLSGAVVYTSCEPCVMCQATGIVAGVSRMVFAASSALAAAHGFPASTRAGDAQAALRRGAPSYVIAGEIPPEDAEAPFAAASKPDGGTLP